MSSLLRNEEARLRWYSVVMWVWCSLTRGTWARYLTLPYMAYMAHSGVHGSHCIKHSIIQLNLSRIFTQHLAKWPFGSFPSSPPSVQSFVWVHSATMAMFEGRAVPVGATKWCKQSFLRDHYYRHTTYPTLPYTTLHYPTLPYSDLQLHLSSSYSMTPKPPPIPLTHSGPDLTSPGHSCSRELSVGKLNKKVRTLDTFLLRGT